MRKPLFLGLLLAGIAAQPLQAQSGANLAPRVEKLEKEMKAVQRKVFPGGSPAFFEPEIAPPRPETDPAGDPASTPIADLTARVNALESQVQSLTGQVETNAYKTRQLEQAFAAFKADAEARIKTLEGGDTGTTATTTTTPATGTTTAATSPVKPPVVKPTTSAGTKVPAERQAALDAIEKPSSSDAAEDGYLYGYRLWEAKFYPEAQAQLKTVVTKYPKHKRASYAQNLLGRAYLDEGKPALASVAFYDSYQKMPKGDRAPDSLAYLGQALTKLKKPADACKVYDEFDQVYGATASATLKAQVVKGRTEAKCKA